MDYEFDEQMLLSNDEEENEEELTSAEYFEPCILEVEPATAVCIVEGDTSFKEIVTELVGEGNTREDPLQENVVTQEKSKFAWLFNDKDLLTNVEGLTTLCDKYETSAASNKCRSKRARLQDYNSANGLYTWSAERSAEAAQHELGVPKQQAAGKGPAATVSTILEAWLLMLDEPIMKEILHCTNEEIRKKRFKVIHERQTDLFELRAWMGLNYLCGIFRNAMHNGPLEELWTPELGNAIFRATMSYKRYVFLSEHISLAESPENLEQVLKLWQKFVINCRSYYAPSAWCSVSETGLSTKGTAKCGYKISLPNVLSDQNELHVLALCDAKTLYMANAIIARNAIPTNNELLQLVCDIKSTCRNVALKTDYTQLDVCQQLLERQLSTTGYLEVDAPDAPVGIEQSNSGTDMVLYTHGATITTLDDLHLFSCGLNSQLDASIVQAHSERASNLFQELTDVYNTINAAPAGAQARISLNILHLMLNCAAINAWVLIRLSPRGDATLDQRDFQRQLGLFLTQQRLQRSLLRTSNTTLLQKIQICEILGTSADGLLAEAASCAKQSTGIGVLQIEKAKLPAGIMLATRHGEKPRRCKPCTQLKRQTKARTRCQQCLVTRCNNHLIARCYQCTGIVPSQVPASQLDAKVDSIKLELAD